GLRRQHRRRVTGLERREEAVCVRRRVEADLPGARQRAGLPLEAKAPGAVAPVPQAEAPAGLGTASAASGSGATRGELLLQLAVDRGLLAALPLLALGKRGQPHGRGVRDGAPGSVAIALARRNF